MSAVKSAGQPTAVTQVVDGSTAVSGIIQPRLATVMRIPVHNKPGDEALKSLARALGRQVARRHLHCGTSIIELAVILALGALIVAALLYAGMLHPGLM